MADHLPPELIVQILLRLPSNSLLSFRFVCKLWLSLISSTQFRLLYLRRNFSRYRVRRVSWTENKELYTIHFNDQHFTLDSRISLEFPLNLYHGGTINLTTIGCCNGVVCLSDVIFGTDETILWNPSIRKKLTLIPPIYRDNDTQSLVLVLGFGYDKITDDFKVLRLSYNSHSITIPNVEVYTVKSAIWRVIRFLHDLPCFCLFPHCILGQLFLNGFSHWIACSKSRPTRPTSILTFDMSTERFGEIQMPENLGLEYPMKLRLVVVQECLGVIYTNRVTNTSSSYVIWAMKEYKYPASWTMVYNIDYPDKDVGNALGLTNNGDFITVSKEGDLKIYNQEGLGCYNVFGSGSEGIVSESTFVERYEESLALLDVGDDVGNAGQVAEEVDD